MICQPITCNGNDLNDVLYDIKSRKCVAWKVETKIGGHNAKYRVSYFERGDRTIESNDSTKDKQQASENHFGKVATVLGLLLSDAGSARNAMTRKPSSVCAEPAALIHLPKPMRSKNVAAGGETRAEKPKSALRAPASILGCRHPLVGESSEVPDCKTSGVTVSAKPTNENGDQSIEGRMAELQSKLQAGGKIKRSKPKTMPDNYRSPYAD